MTIAEAIGECRSTGFAGWLLVEYAQKFVNAHMQYSWFNSFDMPGKAFERGMGYCWQQAGALNMILRGLGFDSRLVHAFRNRFPDTEREGVLIHIGVSGHVWCRVKVGGEERDVCPGSPANKPGVIHFEPLSKVKDYKGLVTVFGYLGSAALNRKRGKRFLEQKTKQESIRNPEKCPCKKTKCENYKKCEPCVAKHYAKGSKPACER